MKTYILQLEPHDDITSVKDKLGWGKSSRILVVWPEDGRLLNRRLDLLLLKRHSESLGAQVALVARDPEIRYHAPRLGIPVFRSIPRAQTAAWRLPRRFRSAQAAAGTVDFQAPFSVERASTRLLERPPRPSSSVHPLIRLSLFALSILSFLLVAALLLPAAEVQLSPQIQDQRVVIPVHADPQVASLQLSGAVPAYRVSVVVEGRDSQPASGEVTLPDRPAVGSVTFTNLTDQEVVVPVGTVVRSLGTEARRFEVTSAGTVPPGPGESISLPVRCLTPGKSGNLPAGSLVALEGLLGTEISAINPEPMNRGTDRTLPMPTEHDRAGAYRRLEASLLATALTELQVRLPEGDLLILSSVELGEVLEAAYQPAEGQPASQVQLTLQAEFAAYAVSITDLRSLAGLVLDAGLPAGFGPVQQTLQIEHLGVPRFQGNSASWELAAVQQVQAQIPPTQAVRLSLGLDPEAARQRLAENFPLRAAPVIRLFPAWWPRLPYLPFRIQVLTVGAGSITQDQVGK